MSDWSAGGEPVPVEHVPDSGEERARSDRQPATGGAVDGNRTAETEDLPALIDELEETLRTLRSEVDADGSRTTASRGGRERPRLPRPPSPREVLRFTESYTIPTVVAFLESAIRALELLAATIRLLDGWDPRPSDREGRGGLAGVGADLGADAGDRAVETGQAALERVDEALAELQRTYEGEPEDPTARRLLDDARTLRSEINDRLAELAGADRDRQADPTSDADPSRETDPSDADGDERAAVDVEAELETLRRSVGRGETRGEEPRDDGSTDGDETGDDAGDE